MTQPSTQSAAERAPSVLVVLIVRDAADRLRESLSALAAQTYPRLAIMAVDNGSTDGSGELLAQALGEGRVIALPGDADMAAALAAALDVPVAADADHILVLHDDAALDPDGVARLVEATAIPGVDGVGIVGAKVVDWDDPRQLRGVGSSADRFGHAYSPLQAGEIDQGQFDRVLEVLSVSSAAMLFAREAWQRVGLFDDRMSGPQAELDLCWRARIAGYRVLMTPLARVRHRGTSSVGDPAVGTRRGPRYQEDRAAIATVLKNYSLPSLLWVVPLSLALGLVRLAFLTLARRFEEAYDLLAAWGWNIAHLPGTLGRRRRVQRVRRIKDRRLRRFMESAGLRLPRWFQTAERILEEQRQIEEGDEGRPVTRRLRDRASLVGSHPVIVGSFVGLVVGAVAIRGLLGPGVLAGGVLPSFPAKASGFFQELDSAFRTTPLGGSLAASPALAVMGGLSALLVASTSLAQKVLLVGAPVLAAVLMYRACARLTQRPGPSVLAAGAYVASALMLWSYSEGRIDLLLALAVLPAAVERLEVAFAPDERSDGRFRFVAGVAVTFAVMIAFLPGALLALFVVVLAQLLTARDRVRGLIFTGEALALAAVLLLPFVPTLVADGGAAFTSYVGTTDVADLARLAFGPGPGTWVIAAFLPLAALIAFALVGPAFRSKALRAMLIALFGLALSWLSAAGYLPRVLSNPLAFGAVAAVGETMVLAYGLASVATGLGRESFGLRQIGTVVLGVTMGVGLSLQAASAMAGGWAVGGPQQIPAAWAVVEGHAKGDFRVLWVGADDGQPFPAPGGDPQALAPAEDDTLRFSLTDRSGVTALDTGRPLAGPGPDSLAEVLDEVISGTSRHAGALLAPFGVRFIVAADGQLPSAVAGRLDAQLDLDLVPAAGLSIYRNATQLPPAAVVGATPAQVRMILAGSPAATAAVGPVEASAMKAVEGGWDGPASDGLIALASEFDASWGIEGSSADPQRSFGWATAFTRTNGPADVRYGAQLPRTIETIALGLFWVVALWITRKPVSR